jgi:hypothetical protein
MFAKTFHPALTNKTIATVFFDVYGDGVKGPLLD